MARWRFRKSAGVRLNVGKRGVGVSVGGGGMRVGVGPRGVYTSAGIPGTGLYGIHYLSRGGKSRSETGPSSTPTAGLLSVTDPHEAARAARREVEAMEAWRLRRVVRDNLPDLHQEWAPGVALALAVGFVALLAGRWWGALLMLYGFGATVHNSRGVTRMRAGLLRLVDEGAADQRRIGEDLERARTWERQHEAGTALAALAGHPPAGEMGLLLGDGEAVRWAVPGAVKARRLAGGTKVEGQGTLVITDRRLAFLSLDGGEDLPLRRVLSAEVDDDARLRLTVSRRKAPLEFIALGSAHTAAAVIRLARARL